MQRANSTQTSGKPPTLPGEPEERLNGHFHNSILTKPAASRKLFIHMKDKNVSKPKSSELRTSARGMQQGRTGFWTFQPFGSSESANLNRLYPVK